MNQIREIYLHVKTGEPNDLISFFSIYENVTLKILGNNNIEISADEDFKTEDFISAREMIIEELYLDFIAFIKPFDFEFNIDKILDVLPELNPGIYSIESLIPEIVILNKNELKQSLRNYYYNLVNHETINTVMGFIDANMNASSASKKMYMHRNTLNYRLDHFIEKTEINVRNFNGALSVYLLFRR